MLFSELELRGELAKAISQSSSSVLIVSAYIKKNTLEWLKDNSDLSEKKVTVVARWRAADLISGASDIEIYELCKDNGWQLKVDERLHSKLYLLDNSTAYLGSANLTNSGFGLSNKSNFELSTKITLDELDINKVSKYVESCVVVTDALYQDMKNFIESIPPSLKDNYIWPSNIKNCLESREVSYLWVDDLFFSNPISKDKSKEDYEHDLSLLGISQKDLVNKTELSNIFLETRVAKWLVSQLRETEGRSLRFGEISHKMHNALLNDPKPYRKQVKDFQSNLYSWIKFLEVPEFSFDRFNHSESISFQK